MKNNDNLKSFLLIILFVISILAVLYIPKFFKKDVDGYVYEEFIKKAKYKVNEYIPIMINDEQMSRKYLNDFINIIIDDIDYSYTLIDEDYKNEKFGSLDSYKKYIYDLKLPVIDTVDKYAVYDLNGYKYYDIYDKDGHRFIFKTKGVMQYKVLFDNDGESEDD